MHKIKRKRIIAASVILCLILAIFAALTVIWRHDPLDVNDVSAGMVVIERSKATGPLLRHASNPRYFTDGSGKAILLTGSHTWNNFQEKSDAPELEFDFTKYLQLLVGKNHNFIRLWAWEQSTWVPWTDAKVELSPLPYLRTGPGVAQDGGLKFDLTKWNPAYFQRLRERVQAAGDNGIYVAVMLFQGWSVGKKPPDGVLGNNPGNSWKGHPFNSSNNINGINGDMDGNGEGKEIHTLSSPDTLALQERYVREIIDTLNDLDNVLWEIANETDPGSEAWQYHMINFIKEYEANKNKQHPVGMTSIYPDGRNSDLLESPADWISPNPSGNRNDPPVGDGKKVIVTDTDHLWGVGGDRTWVWRSFSRGLNPIYMDPFNHEQWAESKAKFESCRRAMGHILAFANRMNLARALPRGDLASTGFCLADPGQEYLVYIPFGARSLPRLPWATNPIRNAKWQLRQSVKVDLSNAPGTFEAEWFDPSRGTIVATNILQGGQEHHLTAPFKGDAVLFIQTQTGQAPNK